MRSELEIRVAQIRGGLEADGDEIARLVRDAYSLGRLDGLRETGLKDEVAASDT